MWTSMVLQEKVCIRSTENDKWCLLISPSNVQKKNGLNNTHRQTMLQYFVEMQLNHFFKCKIQMKMVETAGMIDTFFWLR